MARKKTYQSYGSLEKHRKVIFTSLILAVLLMPFPATVYFKPPLQTGEYLEWVKEHRYFNPTHIKFQSYPEGGGVAVVSRKDPIPTNFGRDPGLVDMHGEDLVFFYSVERLQGISQTIYVGYLNLHGDLVYSQGYVVILIVLLLYQVIRFREGRR